MVIERLKWRIIVIGSKATNMSYIYIAITIISIILFVSYCIMIHEKEIWFIMLAVAVIIVNIGYTALALSKNIEEALLATRISYLGAVFLPMAMLLIILNICKIKYHKLVPVALLIVSIVVFLVAASPGYLDIYYKSVELDKYNGCTVLNKEYGTWHGVYLIYLMMYFVSMVIIVMNITLNRKMKSIIYVNMLVGAVLINIGVWLCGQLVDMEFEFLSVSYVISEFFILCVYFMIQAESDVVNSLEDKNSLLENHNIYDKEYSIVNIGEDVTLEGWAGLFITHSNKKSYGVKVDFSGKIKYELDKNANINNKAINTNNTLKEIMEIGS